jgi:CRP/FNR family transcriptional regulator
MTAEMPVRLLSQVPYFAGLDPGQLLAVAGTAIPRRFDAGQIVLLEGEPCAGMYIIESGWLRSLKASSSGREQTLRIVGPGEVFGDFTMFALRPNASSVVALEPSQVWFVPRDAVLELLDQPPFARLVVQTLASRALQLLSLVEDLSLRSVTARLARLLVENAREDVVPRRRWATQGEMANRLGTVPDVLNRALRTLVAEGLIEVDRHQIRISDRPGLEARANVDA